VINSPCLGQSRKDISISFLVIILGAVLAVLTYCRVRAAQYRRAVRTRFFAAISPRLEKLRRTITHSGFERLSGKFQEREIDLQIVPDTLTYRKLPCFWLLVSQIEPLPLQQKISIMVRPTGFEVFSNFSTLPCQTSYLPTPFPKDVSLRSEHPLDDQEMALLRRHLFLFNDPRMKELVLSPQGLRLTWLLQEANRGRYLLFREAELNRLPLAWDELLPLLTSLEDVRHDLITIQATEESAAKCA